MKQNLLNPRKIFSLLAFSVGFSGLSFSESILRETLFFAGSEQNYSVIGLNPTTNCASKLSQEVTVFISINYFLKV